ncbi:MAG: hypothetical protein ABEJ83_03655 [Candidatus Nanohaloarchaea archaeon]
MAIATLFAELLGTIFGAFLWVGLFYGIYILGLKARGKKRDQETIQKHHRRVGYIVLFFAVMSMGGELLMAEMQPQLYEDNPSKDGYVGHGIMFNPPDGWGQVDIKSSYAERFVWAEAFGVQENENIYLVTVGEIPFEYNESVFYRRSYMERFANNIDRAGRSNVTDWSVGTMAGRRALLVNYTANTRRGPRKFHVRYMANNQSLYSTIYSAPESGFMENYGKAVKSMHSLVIS